MKFIPTCREASQILSAAQDRPLTLREKVALYIHLPICNACRNFRDQLVFMRRAVREFLTRD